MWYKSTSFENFQKRKKSGIKKQNKQDDEILTLNGTAKLTVT